MAATSRHLRHLPTDGYPTPTSDLQRETEDILLKHIPEASKSTEAANTTTSDPVLQRNYHLQFLLRNILQGFPQRYTSQDASQPWLMFWTLQGFCVLGVGLDDRTKRRSRETLLAMQHPDGGFGGGPGQAAHLLPTYAATCALATVGQPGEGGAWDQIDRQKMYDFFMSLKQPDGSFLVSHHGEVDVRGIYCLLAVATLLNLMTPELLDGVPEFISTCQTYEGGFGNASFPDWAFGEGHYYDSSAPRPVLGEAHGGYTFCATASWMLLQPYIFTYYSLSSSRPRPTINTRALIRWLTQMQGEEIELGGFRGRTNKLVDGCYSWWVGGCFSLVEGLLGRRDSHHHSEGETGSHSTDEAWVDVDDALLNREALQEYILYAGQHATGGLRDKPPKAADAYHTLYCLSGLSAAQHRVLPDEQRKIQLVRSWSVGEAAKKALTTADVQDDLEDFTKHTFVSALCWIEDEGADIYAGGSANRVNATQPLFNLTVTHTGLMMAHFYGQSLPARAPRK